MIMINFSYHNIDYFQGLYPRSNPDHLTKLLHAIFFINSNNLNPKNDKRINISNLCNVIPFIVVCSLPSDLKTK